MTADEIRVTLASAENAGRACIYELGICPDDLAELCRLALKVVEAPVGTLEVERGDLSVGIGDLWYVYDADINQDTHAGKRVAIVPVD